MGWKEAAVAKFFDRRRANPKEDMVYLTPHDREKHICHTGKELNFYLEKHLAAADEARGKGRPYFIFFKRL